MELCVPVGYWVGLNAALLESNKNSCYMQCRMFTMATNLLQLCNPANYRRQFLFLKGMLFLCLV